jgi:tellurite resistance protein TerC
VHVAPWVWIVTLVVAVAFLAVDVFVVGRRPHEPSMREVTRDLTFFIGAALLFCAGILVISGPEYAAQFLGGWLTEYSLSIDNLSPSSRSPANCSSTRCSSGSCSH